MTRDELLKLLREHKPTLARRFGVAELALYGSFARDSAAAYSDVEILVRFKAPPNWRQYFDAHTYLEETLERRVDVTMHS